MSGSRANRTAAMIEAAITMVEAKRSWFRLSCSSLEIALFISPTDRPPRGAPDRQKVRESPPEYLCRQVTALRPAERTVGNNPSIWHGSDRGGDGLVAYLAPNGEVAEPGLGQVPHRNSVGEYKAKVIHSGAV